MKTLKTKKKINKLALVVLAAMALALGCASHGEFAARQTGGIGTVKSGYVLVNGLNMYYEIQGAGRPLVLIHGGVCTIDTCFGKVRPLLVKNWKTVAVELQGHGHTADVDRPLTFEQLAEDTAALLRQLKIENADVVGYSIGGGVALQIAMRYPDLVRKLVVIGDHLQQPRTGPRTPGGLQDDETRGHTGRVPRGLRKDGAGPEALANTGFQGDETGAGVQGLAA